MKTLMTMLWLLAQLALSNCAGTGGDFAEIAEPLCMEREASVRWLLANGERGFVVALNVHNDLAGGC